MLELLNQLDGFDARGDVKVILATNRIESLDPALLRPGRIDRKIEFPLPDIKTRRRIFQVIAEFLELSYTASLYLFPNRWYIVLSFQGHFTQFLGKEFRFSVQVIYVCVCTILVCANFHSIFTSLSIFTS